MENLLNLFSSDDLSDTLRNRLEVLFLILSEFKRINYDFKRGYNFLIISRK